MGAAKKVKAEGPLTASVDQDEALAMVRAIETEVTQVSKETRKLPAVIADDDAYTGAADVLIGVVERRKYVEAQREAFLEDVKRMVARVESWFKPALETLAEVETAYRARIVDYAVTLETKAAGLRKAAALLPARDEERAMALLEEAKTHVPPKVAGISFSTPTKVEIIDAKKIPKAFMKMIPDAKKIEAALEAGKAVAGCKLITNTSVRVTPKHAKKDEG